MAATSFDSPLAASPAAVPPEATISRGVTPRVVILCLALAVLFGYMIPIIDVKLSNTFLGAAHLPPGAIAALLYVLLVMQPLMKLASQQATWRAGLIATAILASVVAYLTWRVPASIALLPLLFGAMAIMTAVNARQKRLMLIPAALFLIAAYLAFRVRGMDVVWPVVFALVAVSSFLSFALASFGRAFSRNEMLTIYITCLFSCLVPGHGSESFFVSNLVGPYYFAKAENNWLKFLNEYVPSWFTPALQGDKYGSSGANFDAVTGWYSGTNGVVPWGLWITPLLAWGSLVFVSYFMLSCLSVMLRAQWSDREALAFPLLRLPVEMTADVDRDDKYGFFGRLFRNPLTWIGIGIAVFIQLLNGLHLYFSDVPAFPLEIVGEFFTESPWNQIGWVPFRVLPIVVGITYLLTSEVSFSLWFFFFFIKFQNIVAYYAGFPADTLPPGLGQNMGAKAFAGFQVAGAYFVYVFLILWTGREHFKHIAARAFGRLRATAEEGDEALSYPVAFWGFWISFALIIAWCVFAGMNPLIAILVWACYLVIAVALSRIVVEAGLLFVQQTFTPVPFLAQLFNAGPTSSLMGPQTLVPGSFINAALMTDLRGFIMPSFIQSFKLAQDHKIRMKPLLALILAVTFVTFVLGVYMRVRLGYDNGALTLNGWFTSAGAQKPASDVQPIITGIDPKAVSASNWLWLGFGGLLTYLMMFARSHFLWFPFHPIGYLMSFTYPMHTLWFSIFLGWLAKTTVTKFGSSESYRKLIPIFLGLAMGDVIMMILWLIVGAFTGQTGQQLMPG